MSTPKRSMSFWLRHGVLRRACVVPYACDCDFCGAVKKAVYALTIPRTSRTFNAIACRECGLKICPIPEPADASH
jgi:hypothetical protein